MKREIITTADGSKTISLPEWNEQYHSKFGAIKEAYHVFIKNGLDKMRLSEEIRILEIGFGTGLNCFITLLEAKKNNLNIEYTGVEAYPVDFNEIEKLNYVVELNAEDDRYVFNKMHTLSNDKKNLLTQDFSFIKKNMFFEDIKDSNLYHLIYFDAFGARVQPELWTLKIFKKMYRALKQNGILVTYSAKGSVRRAIQEAGFDVERLPGPPGKREMLRATKH